MRVFAIIALIIVLPLGNCSGPTESSTPARVAPSDGEAGGAQPAVAESAAKDKTEAVVKEKQKEVEDNILEKVSPRAREAFFSGIKLASTEPSAALKAFVNATLESPGGFYSAQ